MNADEALGQIILNYCITHGMSIGDYSKKSGVSKGYISKITKNKIGKYGVSSTIKESLAKGMDTTPAELEKQIENYQNDDFNPLDIPDDDFIVKINNKLKNLNNSDAEKIYNIVSNASSNQLEILCDLLKNMK